MKGCAYPRRDEGKQPQVKERVKQGDKMPTPVGKPCGVMLLAKREKNPMNEVSDHDSPIEQLRAPRLEIRPSAD